MKTRKCIASTLVTLLTLATGPVIAQGDPGIQLDAIAEIEVEVVDEQGVKQVQRQEASLVVPGDEVIYTINYVNSGADPVEDVVITNPVPEHMVFKLLDGSDTGLTVTMSVDGGKNYKTPDALTVVGSDGNERPAQPRDYTHVRWVFEKPVQPGDMGSVGFRAKLL